MMEKKSLKPTVGAVMVVGGGVAGVQSALDLAESGYYVYLLEKSPSVGGVMLQLDKTFPTNCLSSCRGCRAQHGGLAQLDETVPVNDCSTCIISPKLVESGRHANIELIPMVELESVEGEVGNFQVKVRRRLRNLDWTTAPPMASFGDEETVNLNVGAIILATGFRVFDPATYDVFGYGRYPNVITSLEFESIMNPYGPSRGRPCRPSDNQLPKKIAWLQCIGSRDLHEGAHGYCSSVCCMYAIKEALAAKDYSSDIDTTIFYMDMRTFGKEYEAYYNLARNELGVRFVRSRIHSIEPAGPGSDDLKLEYMDDKGEFHVENFDMVVLSVGLEAQKDVKELAGKLKIDLDESGFPIVGDFAPVETSRPGILACGAFAGPKDVPSSITEASASSAVSAALLAASRNTMVSEKSYPPEDPIIYERPRVGVFLYQCGSEQTGVLDAEAVRNYAKRLPNVVYVADTGLSCGVESQKAICDAIKDNQINRVVVAGCSPRTHEKFFQDTIRQAGLNKHLLEMANLLNQDSWVHSDDPVRATEKAKDLIGMAVAKAVLLEPFAEQEQKITQKALVVGGGVAGMVAAKTLAAQGYPVCLVEKSSQLGGYAGKLYKTWRGSAISPFVDELVKSVQENPQIDVRLSSSITHVEGNVGHFQSTIQNGGGEEVVEHGVAILATGGKEFIPNEYQFGKHPRIVTHQQLDQHFKAGEPTLKAIRSAVFIQCVGSREPDRPYCSRVCCTHSIESALELKRINPNCDVYVLYRDMRTYGDREKLYSEARKAGVLFVRFSLDNKPKVELVGGGLKVTVFDPILQKDVVLSPDLITLATAILPNDAQALSGFFKVPVNKDGFLCEAHLKMRPVDCSTDGVFLCGLAHYPKSLDESIVQAQAAASRAATFLAKENIHFHGAVAVTNQLMCSSCGTCVNICPYSAPKFNDKGKAEISPVLCRSCGLCVASCRSGAISLRGYEDAQIFAMIDSL
ncbi:FAD-dependent oxidoreductase [Desulforhabdus amnigena]|uniref:4Fe-4S ferredoxin-type domain-containing protein n=1 Tax=Desulforhabdus amnigena TaxID=40218 RepID=A0A9W6FWV3_9BACT|nr:FAD-dependent oxidoreductase [Desulforhabdus amnigena]GLI36356.1 hypothetical protein DAMNIGENAA_37890 [Desulforhabdus amnigena]